MHVAVRASSLALILALTPLPAAAGENVTGCGPLNPREEQFVSLQQENTLLSTKIRQLEAHVGIPASRLHQRKIQRLREIAADVKTQRRNMDDFQGFVTWMSTNLAGYTRYIQAGSYAATLGRALPIPYAGQVALFAKFAAQFTLELNASSRAMAAYLDSSQKFIALADRLGNAGTEDEGLVAETARFADQRLLKDMNDAQARLAAVSELSSGALSFLASLNHFASCGDDYLNRARGMLTREPTPREKSFITESSGTLKARADRFNARLRQFEELGKKETASVRALAVYDELEREARASLLVR